jgi:TPR repeat protein
MYDNGSGVTQNKSKAVEWYQEAADQGNVAAMHNLGVMYYTGEGVQQDKARGIMYLKMAADQGNENAQKALRSLGL